MNASSDLQYTRFPHPSPPHLLHQIKTLDPSTTTDPTNACTLCVVDASAPDSSNLVGYTTYTISPSPSKLTSRDLLVKSIFVRPENRRQKTGRNLLGHLRQIATEEKCNAIYVNISGENGTGTRQFLERNGFEVWKWISGEREDEAERDRTLMWHAVALF